MKEAFLVDINGVLYSGRKPVDGAVEAIDFLRRQGIDFRVISNTTQASQQSIYNRLSSMGFNIKAEEIFTPATAAIKFLKKKNRYRIFLLSGGDAHKDFLSAGIKLTEKKPDYVVVGDAGNRFTFSNLNKAFNLLLDGAELIALEKDRHYLSDGERLLAAGPFVSALEYASQKKATLIGKPSKEFFTSALKDMNVKPENTVLVGDDLESDILGAQKIGLKAYLVLSGKTNTEALKKTKIKPDKILKTIAEIKNI